MSRCSRPIANRVLGLCFLTAFALAAPASELVERVFVLEVANQQVAKDMRVLRVKQGDSVRLKWTSDQSLKLHLHGYDIEKAVRPGQITEFTFTAHASGRFPVNVHVSQPSQGHAHGEHVLLYVEVHPR